MTAPNGVPGVGSTGSGSDSAGSSLDNNSNGTAFSGTPEPKGSTGSRSEINYPCIHNENTLYQTKHNRKLIRFFTVIAYIFAVSLAAIVLSLYYFFLWDPYLQQNNSFGETNSFGSSSAFLPTGMEAFGRGGRKRVSLHTMQQPRQPAMNSANYGHRDVMGNSYGHNAQMPVPVDDFEAQNTMPSDGKANDTPNAASQTDSHASEQFNNELRDSSQQQIRREERSYERMPTPMAIWLLSSPSDLKQRVNSDNAKQSDSRIISQRYSNGLPVDYLSASSYPASSLVAQSNSRTSYHGGSSTMAMAQVKSGSLSQKSVTSGSEGDTTSSKLVST